MQQNFGCPGKYKLKEICGIINTVSIRRACLIHDLNHGKIMKHRRLFLVLCQNAEGSRQGG